MVQGAEHRFANPWKIDDALETYSVRHWGKDYFGINAKGHVTVHPNKDPGQSIDLTGFRCTSTA